MKSAIRSPQRSSPPAVQAAEKGWQIKKLNKIVGKAHVIVKAMVMREARAMYVSLNSLLYNKSMDARDKSKLKVHNTSLPMRSLNIV